MTHAAIYFDPDSGSPTMAVVDATEDALNTDPAFNPQNMVRLVITLAEYQSQTDVYSYAQQQLNLDDPTNDPAIDASTDPQQQ